MFVCLTNVIHEIFHCVWKAPTLFDFRSFTPLTIVKRKGLLSDANECISKNHEIFSGTNLMIVIWIENYSLNTYHVGYIHEKHVQTKQISANRWYRKGVYHTLEYMQRNLSEIFFKSYNTTVRITFIQERKILLKETKN